MDGNGRWANARGLPRTAGHRAGVERVREAVRTAVEALYDAADDDSATGGPDLGRRIWPTVGVVDESGARFLPDEELQPVVEAIIASRVDNPGGARLPRGSPSTSRPSS